MMRHSNRSNYQGDGHRVAVSEPTTAPVCVDVLIIGAGPGGLAAAKGAKEAGAKRVIILERDDRAGGILNQCIHDGFGLIRYGEQLTGPEYAHRAEQEAIDSGAEILLGHHVVRIEKPLTQNMTHVATQDTANVTDHSEIDKADKDDKHVVIAISKDGLKTFHAKAIVLCTGCRERTRGAISIPGSRPAGIFTAGVVQNLVNCRNIMPAKKNVIILGSGDVGMIMARRLTLEGAKVKAVLEILPEPAGLARNVSQCLYDFGIPIKCKHTVTKIIGKKRLEAIEVSRVDENMKPIKGTEEIMECDCLVLSVGLIPENEVAETAGVILNPKTNGAETDYYLQTNVSGIFSCGNSQKIMDLADFVSEQGELAGKNAVAFITGQEMTSWNEAWANNALKKGFPEPNTITCPLCPNGCSIRWNGEHGEVYSGNKCQRGIAFAEQERVNPKRLLTTTLKVINGKQPCVSVKSKEPVRKSRIMELMANLRKISVNAPVKLNNEINDELNSEIDNETLISTDEVTRL